MRLPPSAPKMCSAWPQLEQMCTAMFSTMPEDRHADLLEHLQAFLRIEQRNVLRRGHDHGARQRHLLRRASAGCRPCRAACRRSGSPARASWSGAATAPAPAWPWGRARSSGCRRRPESRSTSPARRSSPAAPSTARRRFRGGLRCPASSVGWGRRCRRPARPPRAFSRQRQRQVDGGGALADAPFARGHGDDVLHLRQQLHATLHGVGNDLGWTR